MNAELNQVNPIGRGGVVVVMLVAQLCPVLCDTHGPQPTRLLCPWKFSRQEYWSGLPFFSPGDLPNPGIKPGYPALQADSLLSEPLGKPKRSVNKI